MAVNVRCPLITMALVGLLFVSGCGPSGNITPTESTGVAPSSSDDNGCPSIYDGTYQGILTYEYKEPVKDVNGFVTGEYRTVTSGIRVSLTLQCMGAGPDNVALTPTRAIISHAHFGCQVGGCDLTPENSFADLPAGPTLAGRPPESGRFISFSTPNGGMVWLGDPNLAGSVHVGVDGKVLSNGLDPTHQCRTWFAGQLGDVPPEKMFPEEAPKDRIDFCFKSWTISKTT